MSHCNVVHITEGVAFGPFHRSLSNVFGQALKLKANADFNQRTNDTETSKLSCNGGNFRTEEHFGLTWRNFWIGSRWEGTIWFSAGIKCEEGWSLGDAAPQFQLQLCSCGEKLWWKDWEGAWAQLPAWSARETTHTAICFISLFFIQTVVERITASHDERTQDVQRVKQTRIQKRESKLSPSQRLICIKVILGVFLLLFFFFAKKGLK